MKKIIVSFLFLIGVIMLHAQEIKHLNYEEFKKMYVGGYFINKKACVIDFYADWCGPCRQMTPIFKKVGNEYAGKYNFYKVNVDEESNLSALFEVRSIPTLIFIPATNNKSKKHYKNVGRLSETALKKMIKSYLK